LRSPLSVENERLVSHSWCREMMKAGSCRSTDVTKLLQKQRRDSQCSGIGLCRIFVYGEDFCYAHLSRNPQRGHRVENSAVSPRKFFSISCVAINLTRRRRRKNCDASTYQSNNFGVSRKRFKPSTPGLGFAIPNGRHSETAPFQWALAPEVRLHGPVLYYWHWRCLF